MTLKTWVARFVVDHGRVTEEGGRLRSFERRRLDEPDVDLHVLAEPSGAKGEDLGAQAIDAIGRLFSQDRLSVTGGLQRAIIGTHQTLLDWNRRSLPRDQVSVGIVAAAVTGNVVYAIQSGPPVLFARSRGEFRRLDPPPESAPALGEGDLAPAVRRFELMPGDIVLAASSVLESIADAETLRGLLERPAEEALPELYLLTRDLPNFALFAIACLEEEPDPEPPGRVEEELTAPDYLTRRGSARPAQDPNTAPSASEARIAAETATAAVLFPQSENGGSPPAPVPPVSPPPIDISRTVVRLRSDQPVTRTEYARTIGPPRRLRFRFTDRRILQFGGAVALVLLIVAFVPDLVRESRSERLAGLIEGAQMQFAAAQDEQDPARRRDMLEETRRLSTEALRIDEGNATASQLHEQATAALKSMDAVFDLSPLTTVTTLSRQVTGELSVSALTVHAGTAYLLDTKGRRILAVSVTAPGPPTVVFEEGQTYAGTPAKAPAYFTWEGPDQTGRLLVLDAERKLFEVRPGSAPQPLALRRTNTWRSVAGIAAYDGNLYVLDPAASQVHRYLPAASGFDSEPVVLLAPQESLKETVALAVEGDVYVVLRGGEVRRFRNGARQPFALGGIDFPIQAALDITIVPEAGEVYILDSGRKRIVVADKDGAFRRQFVSNEFTDLRAIAIDAATSQLYVVVGDALLTAPLVR
ncbi:MAG TPA: hypothetical protein VNN21_05665 [Dehalococcoidia bacterium]|nr:hypothetical protein [Dehalococcoidia bacterium]